MKQTFEDYLGEVHCRENPLILDDHLPDHFSDWLAELEQEDLIKYADEFAIQAQKELLDRAEKRLVIWIAEYVYKKANLGTKMDTPSIVYEQVEKDIKPLLEALKKSITK